MEESASQAVANLTAWVDELERRIHEIDLLSDLDDQLHRCSTTDEIYQVTATLLKRLFMLDSGALYLCDPDTHRLNRVAVWGKPLPGDWRAIPRQCRALRTHDGTTSMNMSGSGECFAVSEPLPTNYLCVPVVVRDQKRGLLQIWHHSGPTNGTETNPCGYLPEAKQRLALAVVELIALALENITPATQTQLA